MATVKIGLCSPAETGIDFSTPEILDPAKNILGGLMLYDSSGGTYENLTSAGSSVGSGDIYHSASSTLFKRGGGLRLLWIVAPVYLSETAIVGGRSFRSGSLAKFQWK